MIKIIVDSSSNLLNGYIKDKDVLFSVVPLTIRVGAKEFVDKEGVDVDAILNDLSDVNNKAGSSCPSPYDFEKELSGADFYFIVTISSKLSGCYNSALVASNHESNIFVIDSLSTAGAIQLIADKIYKLYKAGKSFSEIKDEIVAYRDSLNVLFVLDCFDNLIRNGRMNKIVAFIASKTHIKPLCEGVDGEIKIKAKIRTFKGCLHVLATEVNKIKENDKEDMIIISHTKNIEGAHYVESLLKDTFSFKNILITENSGLCSYYSLEGGIIVCF